MGSVKIVWKNKVVTPRMISGHNLTKAFPRFAADDLGIVDEYATHYPSRTDLTQGQFAEIIAATSPDVAAALVCTTAVTTGEEALDFLKGCPNAPAVGGYREVMAEAAGRRTDLGAVLDMLAGGLPAYWQYQPREHVADVIEACSMKSLRGWDEIMQGIAEGDISWSFVKALGVVNVCRYDSLLELEGRCSDAEAKALVRRSRDASLLRPPYRPALNKQRDHLHALAWAVKAVGAEVALSLQCPDMPTTLKINLRRKEVTAEEVLFMDRLYAIAMERDIMWKLGGPPQRYESERDFIVRAHSYHERAGVSPEQAIEMMLSGVTVEQAEAIKAHGVAAPVSAGWL